jgi:hypothetical protein
MVEQSVDTGRCLNCGARLTGQYCGECGQRATQRLISVWELVRDAFGDLFEVDSRLWRTIRPLLFKPGALTRDYLEGRRARYMPPFRMYLVLSLIFFVIAFFDPRDDLAILYEPVAEDSPAAAADSELNLEEAEAAREQRNEVLAELAEEGVLDPAILDPDSPTGITTEAEIDQDGINVSINGNTPFGDCDVADLDIENAPEWLKRRMTPERYQQTCERLNAVGPAGVGQALLDRVPAALLILLPAMALVLIFLYPLSRRYYVEHLLFFVHFHAFFFLLLTLQVLWGRLIEVSLLSTAWGVIPIIATSFYVPVYLHKSMRHVYGQGGFLTFIKFLILSIAYVIGFGMLMVATVLLTVFSV